MGLLDAGRVEHGNRIAVEEILSVQRLDVGRIGSRIAARRPRDAAPAAAEVAHLVVPAAMIAAELVNEQDRCTFARLLVVDACAL